MATKSAISFGLVHYLSDEGTELRNKRNKRVIAIYPELKDINKQVNRRCILDGEIFVLSNGKPDFFEVQRRSLMSNAMKISLAATKLPVCFTAFDVLYAGNEQITHLPLIERKTILNKLVTETPLFAVSRIIERNGIAFYEAAASQGLEGIVAKHKDSKYYFGKRTKEWIKIKNLCDEDFVVCGYYMKSDNVISVIIGAFVENRLIYQGHVVMGVSRYDFQKMQAAPKAVNAFYPDFPNFENAVWLKPSLVCKVSYMERTRQGGLRQPVFKGLRDDKIPAECMLKSN